MVVGHFDVLRAIRSPTETNPELIVDPDRVLSFAASAQRLKPVTGRQPQIAQVGGGIEIAKLAARDLDQTGSPLGFRRYRRLPWCDRGRT